MATKNEAPATGAAFGYPPPDEVPGPTERLRQLQGDQETEPQEPKFGRVPAEQAATEDHADLHEVIGGRSSAGDAARASMAALANRVAEQTAERVRAEMDARDIPGRMKEAGKGIGALGLSGGLALGAFGATTAAIIAALSEAMPVWAASVITAAAFAAPAAVLAISGQRRVRAPLGLTADS
ncbi:MAG: phage holin family protein [Thermoplasmata archaeon]